MRRPLPTSFRPEGRLNLGRRTLLAAAAGWAASGSSHAAATQALPGDDFFAYANADWLKDRMALAPGQPWRARQEIEEHTLQQVRALWNEVDTGSPRELVRKVASFRDAYLDRSRINALGLRPLQALLRRIDALDGPAMLAHHLGAELRADCDPLGLGVFASPHLFGLAVQQDVEGRGRYQACLFQGGLGLGEPAAYLDNSAQAQARRADYLDRLGRDLSILGQADSPARAADVLALESRLAAAHEPTPASDDPHRAELRWRLADFEAQAPGLDWPRFFAAAGLPPASAVVPWQPGALRAQAALLASEPLSVWRDHLRLNLWRRHAEVLPGLETNSDRSDQARAALDQSWPQALGRLYVERYFPPEQRHRVQAIVTDIRGALDRHLAAADWMSPPTRARARTKLAALYVGVGHPDVWRDHRSLRMDAQDAFGNQRRLANWNTRFALSLIDQPVDRRQWWLPAHAVAGLLMPLQRAYNFAAGLLQPPRFDARASDASNLGAIGAVFGHELSHFFDEVSAEADEFGRARPWWTEADRAALANASQALKAQIAAYPLARGWAIDPERTLAETRADLVGLGLAFDAHRQRLVGASEATVHEADRDFFLGHAHSWRSFSTDESLRDQLATDSHAPDRFRVDLVRNLDAWYAAFDVRPGQALYLAPAQRVRVW